MNATQLANALGLSKGRISQLVRDGKLDGCYTGEGRARRFELRKAAEAMGKRLDPGQRLGNGAATEEARQAILAGEAGPAEPEPPRDGGELAKGDDDRYKLARTLKAEEEARRMRRQNAEDEGRFVLAEAAGREARRLMAAEIAGFETVIRDGARSVADRLGVDFKEVRAILRDIWRTHRAGRAEELAAEAPTAAPTEDETREDI